MITIDKVYLINLDRRPDRLQNMKNVLQKLGGYFKDFHRFSAIDGNNLSDEEIYKICSTNTLTSLKNKSHLHADIRSKGGIGCYLSHLNAWKDMVKNNYKNIIILEDDTSTPNDLDKINNFIKNLPQDFHIAFLSHYNFNSSSVIPTKVNDFWNKSDGYTFYNLDAYIISNEGARKFIEKALPISNQVDSYINVLASINKDIKRYFSKDVLFFQNKSVFGSDIQQYCRTCDINQAADFANSDLEFLNRLRNIYGLESIENFDNFNLNNKELLNKIIVDAEIINKEEMETKYTNILIFIVLAFICFLGSVYYLAKSKK